MIQIYSYKAIISINSLLSRAVEADVFVHIPSVILILKFLMCILVQEVERNTLIKDTMRGDCVPQLVQSWHDIMVIIFNIINYVIN